MEACFVRKVGTTFKQGGRLVEGENVGMSAYLVRMGGK
jgi:hypothetical protein